jgi:cysteine-rich repeat protein
MRRLLPPLAIWLAATSLVFTGCDEGDDTPDGDVVDLDAGLDRDGGIADGGDPCQGLELCDAAGFSCDGDTLVECAANPDGCLVETETACDATAGGFCDDEATPPACDVDPCEGLDLCDEEGRACSDDTLVVCAMNADGCLVETSTDCTGEGDGAICDDGGEMAVCAIPVDPCDGLANACTTAGRSCDGAILVDCAPDAFGCLVETSTACDGVPGGACDATADPICTGGGECGGDDLCDTAGVACDGPDLVVCAEDAFGCLRETATDCTGVANGFCDAEATTPACGVLPTDPCRDVTQCAEESRACSADDLVICAPDAFGCLLEATTDCTATEAICDPEAPASCQLVPCPAARTPLACGGTVAGDTSTGTLFFDGNACDAENSYAGAESAFTFVAEEDVRVTFALTAAGGTTDEFDLFVLEGSEAVNSCDDTSACLGQDVTAGADGTVTVDLRDGTRSYVLYDLLATAAGPTTAFDLTVTCEAPSCGDGALGAFEVCDDGNAVDGDGCSSTCQIEMGYECGETLPSVCGLICSNGRLDEGEACDDGNVLGADGCSSTCAIEAGFECDGSEPSVCGLICSNGRLDDGEACDDGNVLAEDGCDAACAIEEGFECAGEPSVCGLLCSNGRLDDGETCDDGNVLDADGCDATCQIEPGFGCTGTPSVCAPLCGNGTLDPGEGCDDANATAGDGCDLCALEIPTAPAPAAVLSGSIDATDPTYERRNSGCSAPFSPSSVYYDTFVITNPGTATLTAEVIASWSGDGYLFVYDEPFDPAAPADNCLDGNDDFNFSTAFSGLTFEALPGQRYVVVATTFSATTATGSYTIDVSGVVCGNGIVETGESCDDGNGVVGDGCDDTCAVETGYTCRGEPSDCRLAGCGNGYIEFGEDCDDDNTTIGDGCSDLCEVEADFGCTGEPSVCVPECGNGIVVVGEACDDGNVATGDGCDAMCMVEATYTCRGSTCSVVSCGNSVVDVTEACDDGNTVAGDGCDSCADEIAASGSGISITGAVTTADGLWDRISASCTGSGTADHYFREHHIINSTGAAQTIDITAAWASGDGYLHVYDGSFDPAAPLTNCLIGDDDYSPAGSGLPATGGSQVVNQTIAAGQELIIVASTFSGLATISSYTIDVDTD